MAQKRLTRMAGDSFRTFASEDGQNYRGEHQNLGPVIVHIKHLSQMVNTAPKAGNRNGWHYAGSTTPVLLAHWCKMTGHTHHEFATTPELKTKHMQWLHSEMSKLRPEKKKSSQILIPGGAKTHLPERKKVTADGDSI